MATMKTLNEVVERLGVTMERLALSHEENERARRESESEMRRSIAESEAKMRRSIAESDAKIAASDAKIAAAVAGMNDLDGKWGNRIGDLTEKVLVPGIRQVMKRHGHDFTRMCPNEEFYSRGGTSGRTLTEVDLFLENPEEAMAVEVKTRMCDTHVTQHMERLTLLREYENVLGLKGRPLYGAMAGLVIDEKARELALENGLYIVEVVENTKHVNVVEPPAGVRGW